MLLNLLTMWVKTVPSTVPCTLRIILAMERNVDRNCIPNFFKFSNVLIYSSIYDINHWRLKVWRLQSTEMYDCHYITLMLYHTRKCCANLLKAKSLFKKLCSNLTLKETSCESFYLKWSKARDALPAKFYAKPVVIC